MDEETAARVREVDEHLRATETLPVDRSASAYLGEAAAVAADLAVDPPADDVVAERLGHVVDLLSAVDGTDSEAADEHVAAALTAARAVRQSLAE